MDEFLSSVVPFFLIPFINHDTSVLSGALTTQEMLTSFSCIMFLRWDFFFCIKGLNKDFAVQVKYIKLVLHSGENHM